MNAVPENANTLMRMRTWFGITAAIEIRNRSWHRAGFGRLLIPHPPVVNWLLRFGLSDDAYRKLSILHEFGHFQVLPFITLYTLGIGTWIFMVQKSSIIGIIAILVSIHTTWEIMAELVVRFRVGVLYSRYYSKVSVIPELFSGMLPQ